MNTTKRMAMGFAALLNAGYLQAGAQCRVRGVVGDAGGTALGDATITVTTPSLTTFNVSIKSDAKGVWSTLLPD